MQGDFAVFNKQFHTKRCHPIGSPKREEGLTKEKEARLKFSEVHSKF
jgi:hypothetical protein